MPTPSVLFHLPRMASFTFNSNHWLRIPFPQSFDSHSVWGNSHSQTFQFSIWSVASKGASFCFVICRCVYSGGSRKRCCFETESFLGGIIYIIQKDPMVSVEGVCLLLAAVTHVGRGSQGTQWTRSGWWWRGWRGNSFSIWASWRHLWQRPHKMIFLCILLSSDETARRETSATNGNCGRRRLTWMVYSWRLYLAWKDSIWTTC